MQEKDTYNNQSEGTNLPNTLRVMPFSIPDNFFENQQESILKTLKINSLASATTAENFSTPAGYFDNFEEQIRVKLIEDRFKSQIPDLGLVTPAGYFADSESSIKAKIAESNLKATVAHDGFTVPTDYFVAQKTAITASIAVEQLKPIASDTGYSVPKNYFSALTQSIQGKISTLESVDEEPKIITLSSARKWISYASTAAVIFFIGIGSYFALTESSTSNTSANYQASSAKINLQQVSDEEILSYLAQVSEGEELIHLTKFSDKESSDNNPIDNTIKDEDIKEYLNYML